VSKRILKDFAGNWLAALMQEQLTPSNNDPTKVKLNIGLTYIRKYVNFWLKQTLQELNTDAQIPNNLRGWKESGMLDALTEDKNADHPDFLAAKELYAKGEIFMDFTGKKNAQKAEQILQKHFERHGVISGNQTRSGVFDALVQSDEEIGPTSTDLLSDDVNEPRMRVQCPADLTDSDFTMEQLQEMDDWNCESVFESVDNMFPALEANGRHVQANLDWDFIDQTSE
jgi:hypothetical protein